MEIDENLLKRLEKLSHLRISEEKREEIMSQLSDILRYVENLNELDTEGLDPYFSTLKGGTPMREDRAVRDTGVSEDILSHAPEKTDGFFVVPAIIG